MISSRNRVVQIASGEPVTMAEVNYVVTDRCSTVFVPAFRIGEVLDLAERFARCQDGMVEAVRAARSVEEVMHDERFEAIRA